MEERNTFPKRPQAHLLRLILAGVFALTLGMAGAGQTLQAAAKSLSQTRTGNVAVGVTLPLAAPATNDNFPGTTIPSANIPFNDLNVDTTVATTDTDPTGDGFVDPTSIIGEGDCNSDRGEASVWYSYTPTANINLYVDTVGSNYDTLLAVWKGNPNNHILVACNDDISLYEIQSKLGFYAQTGSTYYIEVIDYAGPAPLAQAGPGGTLNFHVEEGNFSVTDVYIGGQLRGSYTVPSGQDRREYYDLSGGPVIVDSINEKAIVSAIRLQSYASNTLYSFKETIGVPAGLLSHKYYFPSYNNIWAPLNSQVRFANLGTVKTEIRVTIGGTVMNTYIVDPQQERREYYTVSGGPVIVESLPDDPVKGTVQQNIVAAIRLQSYDYALARLYSFAETMGIPDAQLATTYYFPSYNNIWAPLNSQVRFGVP